MLIGELSQKTGLSKDTIRFYEKRGMIQLSRKQRRDNNYKEYPDEVFERLQVIKRIKYFGFTLQEITDLLMLMDEREATCNHVAGRIDEKVKFLDVKIAALTQLKMRLLRGVQQCRQNEQSTTDISCCPILVSDEFNSIDSSGL